MKVLSPIVTGRPQTILHGGRPICSLNLGYCMTLHQNVASRTGPEHDLQQQHSLLSAYAMVII
eukprot:SAG11_NODE_692_length_7698_cov_4.143308_8_plen_63_part_00